jgi:hypothetical protein
MAEPKGRRYLMASQAQINCHHLICTCRRDRCSVGQGERIVHAEHPCPYTTIILGKPTTCDCCPICTALCLPRKVYLRNPEIACFDSIQALVSPDFIKGVKSDGH